MPGHTHIPAPSSPLCTQRSALAGWMACWPRDHNLQRNLRGITLLNSRARKLYRVHLDGRMTRPGWAGNKTVTSKTSWSPFPVVPKEEKERKQERENIYKYGK